jgi:AraC-like DNA-binding protein
MSAFGQSSIVRDGHRSLGKVLGHGDRVDLHHPRLGQLLYPASGVLVTTTEHGTWMAPANRVAWTPPGSAHCHRFFGETDIRMLEVGLPLCTGLPQEPSIFAVTPLVREVLLALTGERSYDPDARDRLCEVVVDELTDVRAEPLRLPEPSDRRLSAVTEWLHAHPHDSASLSELGRRVGSSERTLSRLFRDELGMSFNQWRTLLRIQHALIYLIDGLSVSQTATELGWANPTSFIEAFTAILGQTPGRFLRQGQASDERGPLPA